MSILNETAKAVTDYLDEIHRVNKANKSLKYADEIHSINGIALRYSDLRILLALLGPTEPEPEPTEPEWIDPLGRQPGDVLIDRGPFGGDEYRVQEVRRNGTLTGTYSAKYLVQGKSVVRGLRVPQEWMPADRFEIN